jgi:integrative and conjugative element protein (TIGR02256 family)
VPRGIVGVALDNPLIEHEACLRRRVESGGALFGWTDDGDVVIACAYGPGPRARHRATTFEPHPATTDRLIAAVHHATEGRYRYLGSWHRHPNGLARPSGTDVATTAAVASEPEVRLPCPLVVIQATRRTPTAVVAAELRAWHWELSQDWLLPATVEAVDLDGPACPIVTLPRSWGRRTRPMSPTAPASETHTDPAAGS